MPGHPLNLYCKVDSPDLHHCVIESLLMISLPRSSTALLYIPCLTRADRGDLILATCSSAEDVFAKTLSVPTPLQRLAYCVTHMN